MFHQRTHTKILINKVLKYDTENEKDEEAGILNKRQKIRRMVACKHFDAKWKLPDNH